MKKTTGIICENGKVDKFKSQLQEDGFGDFSSSPFSAKPGHTIIRVRHDSSKTHKLQEVAKKVTNYYKQLKDESND